MGVMAAASAAQWQQIVSRSFVPLECETPSSEFRASLADIRLTPGLSVSDISSDAAVINRTPRLAARAGSDDLHISLQVRSAGVIRQSSTSVAMRPGSVAVYPTHQPYQLDYSAPGQRIIVLQIARRELGSAVSSIAAAGPIAVADTAARRVFTSYVTSLVATHDHLDGQTRDDFARVTVELASTMLRSSGAGRRGVPGSPESLLYTIQTFIREHARTADLTPDDIARAHYISRRKLYDLFAQVQTTPSAYLRAERLLVAARLLTHRDGADSVTGIALRCGFSDATTFTRAFRGQFGMTPREWRGAGGQDGRGPATGIPA